MLQIEYPHSSSPFAIRSRRILCTFFIYFLFRFFVVQYLVLFFFFFIPFVLVADAVLQQIDECNSI